MPARSPARARSRRLQASALILLALVGPVLFILGQSHVRADAALERSGARAVGTVVSFADTQRASRRSVLVAFVAPDGSTRSASARAQHEQHPIPGDAVQVAYDPADPDRAVVVGYGSTWEPLSGMGLVLTLVTLALAVAGAVLRWFGRRRASLGTGAR